MIIPAHVVKFISALAELQPQMTDVWLIGSRANERATEKSDTDLIVFGSKDLIDAAKECVEPPTDIDCLIVYDGDNYRDPWQDKTGSLTELNWKPIDSQLANYVGTKFIQDYEASKEFDIKMGSVEQLNERAVRFWP